ncbi:MAG TPA: 50S ribosomal protein L10 [Gaiellaceae bacterium]|nr:50S ribosomal protein L10 [Gaiellaceae bacterium]
MLRKDKEQVVAELAERLRSSDTLFLADYRGLSVSELDDVRTKLLEHGARFSVVKNTLTRRAASEAGLESLLELLEGPTAIAFVGEGDMVAVARTLNETARRTRILEIKGGILEGTPMAADQVVELASLPPADVLRGQVLGAIVGPVNAIVGLFAAPVQDLVGLLDARIEQLGGEGAAEAAAEPAEAEEPAEPAEEESEEPAEAPAAESTEAAPDASGETTEEE